jgi:hypothetical protein
MTDNRQSIIAKVVGKQIVTPYEAIYLQYLNILHIREQTSYIEYWENPYIATEKVSGIYSQYDLNRILSFQTIEEASLYDAYRWAANMMVKVDTNNRELGYKGLALLNELEYFQREYIAYVVKSMHRNIAIEQNLPEFISYSHVHQQNMTFIQILESFTETFNFFLINIDNTLTLNYYLNTMASPVNFYSSELLKVLLNKKKPATEEESEINMPQLCYSQIINICLRNNHEKFVEFMRRQLSLSFNKQLGEDFLESSLLYVRNCLSAYNN